MNPLDLSAIHIEPATEQDLPQILALFDAAVRWLVEQGLSDQWGTRPFSQQPAEIEDFTAWIRQGSFFVARQHAAILGTIVIVAAPPAYSAQEWNQTPRTALYLKAFTTDRRYAGQDLGRLMLDWVERLARSQGIEWLRLDCWAGNTALRRYYRRQGFEERGEFGLGAWRGMLFEKQLLSWDR
ncbi:MAG TPA: GNAT family N-acetyltransferase [Herpetosiphonaceae bacterium]